MKVKCIHGYFIFEEQKKGQASDLMSRFGFELESVGPYLTFSDIVDAPKYSLFGKPYLGFPAIKTFEGEPWEVFEENGIVFNFLTGLVQPILSVVQAVKIQQAGNIFVTSGLILPGSLTERGDRVKGYSAYYSRDRLTWQYSEVQYV